MKPRTILFLALLCLLSLVAPCAQAQCPARNTAFKSGETLMYDLYFNWKFVWVKAGTAYMNTTETTYHGRPALRTYLITRGSPKVDRFFVMRDTLTCYMTPYIEPLYYRKGALEGKTFRLNEVWYDYKDGRCNLRMRYRRDKLAPIVKSETQTTCPFDMISMLQRARSFDPSTWRKGHCIKFLMADGQRTSWQTIVYRGKKNFKMEKTNIEYRCLVFSFMEREDGKEKEVVRFYITDDKNHLPVRLDLNLNFGTAKAFLTGARGVRNPQTARVK